MVILGALLMLCGPGAGAHALKVGRGVVCGGLTSTIPPPGLSALIPATAARRAAVWQPALWIRSSFEPQINADIAAKIRLYLNFCRIIKIKVHNGRYLCSSVFICG
jgi:hypothetical protein